jgi:hypothetical protein
LKFACVFTQKRARPRVYGRNGHPTWRITMPTTSTAGTFEACADELNDFINTLDRYPHTVLAFVLRAHLTGLLQALLFHGLWTREDIVTFLEEMERETLDQNGNP